MEAKLLAVFTAGLKSVCVSDLCAELGISRDRFYHYRKRFVEEGPAGLVPRSRRPRSSPQMMAPDVEDEIVRLRKALVPDAGAQTIAYHLGRSGWPVPSISAIHRALVRRGMVTPQPEKRPRSSWRRFEWPRPNDAWQIDATAWLLATGQEVWIMDLLDDHSRVALAARVYPSASSEAAWAAFCWASQHWQLPANVMSDNGSCFTGRFLSGGEVEFERDLRALGIHHILSSPRHPQTCGKLERFHQTLKGWLRCQPLASSPTELQDQVDTFLDYYNQRRPHRALDGATPAERWHASAPATPGQPIPGSPRATVHTVNNSKITWGRHEIALGAALNRQKVVVIARDDDLSVFATTGLVRRLKLDRTRRYQASGKPPGRPKRTLGPCH